MKLPMFYFCHHDCDLAGQDGQEQYSYWKLPEPRVHRQWAINSKKKVLDDTQRFANTPLTTLQIYDDLCKCFVPHSYWWLLWLLWLLWLQANWSNCCPAAVSCCFLILSSAAPLLSCAGQVLPGSTTKQRRMSECRNAWQCPVPWFKSCTWHCMLNPTGVNQACPNECFFCKSLAKQQPDFRIGSLLPSRRYPSLSCLKATILRF